MSDPRLGSADYPYEGYQPPNIDPSGAAHPGTPPGPPKKKSNIKIALIAVVVLILGAAGGCTAVLQALLEGRDEETSGLPTESDREGGPDNPMEVEVGEPFTIDGMRYRKGWKVVSDKISGVVVKGLRVENQRSDESSEEVGIEISFLDGQELLAQLSCSSDRLAFGQVTLTECMPSDRVPKGYTSVTANATF